jgi:hypothetical protein
MGQRSVWIVENNNNNCDCDYDYDGFLCECAFWLFVGSKFGYHVSASGLWFSAANHNHMDLSLFNYTLFSSKFNVGWFYCCEM